MTRINFLITVVIVSFFVSCKKDNTNNTNTDAALLAQTFIDNQSTFQIFTVNATTGGSFTTTGGIRVVVPPNAFVTPSGALVSGNVGIKFNEYLKPADMIFSKILPVSNGEPLLSGGEFKMEATQSNFPLLVAPNKTIEVNLPQFGNNTPDLEVFFGELKQTLVADPMNNVNWLGAQKDTVSNFIVYNGDTVKLFTDSMGYCNADRFMTSPNYKTFNINITGGTVNETNTTAYAVYDDYLGMWPMYGCTTSSFSEDHVPGIPVHFVVFGVYDGVFKAGTLGATPVNGGNYTVNLTATTPQALKTLINSF